MIRDADGDEWSLESRLRSRLEDYSDRMWPISSLLEIRIERVGVTDDDQDCGLLEQGETLLRG